MIYYPYSVKLKMGALEICLSVCKQYSNYVYREELQVMETELNEQKATNERLVEEREQNASHLFPHVFIWTPSDLCCVDLL